MHASGEGKTAASAGPPRRKSAARDPETAKTTIGEAASASPRVWKYIRPALYARGADTNHQSNGMGEKSMETSRERCEEQSAVKKEWQATPNPPPQRQTEIDRSHVLHTKRLYWFGRRTQDIVLSLIALLILWPLMLIVALVIWIDSPGASTIFAQERVGRDGKRFMFLNIRWMESVGKLHKKSAERQPYFVQ